MANATSPTAGPAAVEIMIAAMAGMLEGLGHVAVGACSPIAAAAALLAKVRAGNRLTVTIIGSRTHNAFTDGACELFDCAGQGRLDAFFLSGGQIDGKANINLLGVGAPAAHPRARVRFPGSFGSTYLYFLVPRVILFHHQHTPRVLVDRAAFISAPGTSPPEVQRSGGPYALVTPLCVFHFDGARGRFSLASTHPGVLPAAVRAATGFAYDEPGRPPETPAPDGESLVLLRSVVARAVAETYPLFAARIWGIARE